MASCAASQAMPQRHVLIAARTSRALAEVGGSSPPAATRRHPQRPRWADFATIPKPSGSASACQESKGIHGKDRSQSCDHARLHRVQVVFFFNDAATTEIYTLSLHDALPI